MTGVRIFRPDSRKALPLPSGVDPGRNMKADRRILCLVLLATVSAIMTMAASAQTFQLVATPNQYEFNNTLWASAASSPNDIWAVGNTTIHFDGKQWTEYPAPGADDSPSNFLRGVLDFSPTQVFAGGGWDDKGQIIDRWNGKEWQRVPGVPAFPPAWIPLVMTMSGTSPKDIWVSGSLDVNDNPQLFFEHWNGQSWSEDYLPGGVAFLYGASQDATNDAWVVGTQWDGYYEIPLVVHYNGNNWINVSLPLPSGYAELQGVLALAPNNVWAVGWQNPVSPNYYTNLTLIYHFDGNSWTIVPSPDTTGTNLNGIVANSPNDMYAFGYAADPSGYGFDSLLLHWNGSEWKIIPSPNPRNNPNYIQDQLLTGVIPSPGNIWIFGDQFDSPHGICTDGSCTLAIHTTSGSN